MIDYFLWPVETRQEAMVLNCSKRNVIRYNKNKTKKNNFNSGEALEQTAKKKLWNLYCLELCMQILGWNDAAFSRRLG